MKSTILFRSKYFIKSCREQNCIPPFTTVLDVGCGNGIMAEEFKRSFMCNITGTDILNYIENNIPFTQMPSEHTLPFITKSFDIVTIIDVLHHTDNYTQATLIKEAKRVGKKVLIIETAQTLKAKVIDIAINYIHNKNMAIPLNFHSDKYWFEKLQEHFNDIKHFDISTSFYYPLRHFGFICKSTSPQ